MATMQCYLMATIKNYLVAAAITTRVLVIPFSQMAGFVLTNLLILSHSHNLRFSSQERQGLKFNCKLFGQQKIEPGLF